MDKIINKKIKLLIVHCSLLILLTLFFQSCSSDKKPAEKEKPQKPLTAHIDGKAIKIKTANVEARTIERMVEITGTLAAWEEVTVSSEVSGTIQGVFADLGDAVKQGQVVLTFDLREPAANLKAAEENLKTNEKNYERVLALRNDAHTNLKRYEGLFAEDVISKKDMDAALTQYYVQEASLKQAESMINQAKAQVIIAKKHLADTEILSPISGEVKKRFVSAGETIQAKTPLFIIVKNDPLKLKTQVSEQFVGEIKVGQGVRVAVDAFPERVFTGNVTRISPAVDEKTRAMDIEVRIPNPKRLLKSGLFAKGNILTKRESNVPFVPEGAVYSFVGINKVYVVKDGKVQDRPVKTGVRENGFVELIEGVKPGEIVAASSLDQLFEGAKVEVK
ncbi:MAG: efflux RND transporter periplasmic adaptor subunit [Deltaproteobacteria bacterium]|nr:efflux RND transporter periplasmic adaptor subunit [Deltaproteobacteria bacterium]